MDEIPVPSAPTELVTAIRAHDYANRKQLILEAENHQRTITAVVLASFAALLGLLLDPKTHADSTRLFLLLSLSELVVAVGAYFTRGSARTIDHAAQYVAGVERSVGFRGWESLLWERRQRERTGQSERTFWQKWVSRFPRHLALVYLGLAAVPLYLRLDLGGGLTTLQAATVWILEGFALFMGLRLLLRKAAGPAVDVPVETWQG